MSRTTSNTVLPPAPSNLAEKAEADRIAAEQNDPTGAGGAGGAALGSQVSQPAAGVVPKRNPVRLLGKSDTRAVVTDDVETWTVDLADGDPTKSTAPSLQLRSEQEADGTATPAPKATKPQVVGETATHRVLDNGVNRWKEEKKPKEAKA